MFQFNPKVLKGVEVKALDGAFKFFHTELIKPCLYSPRFVHLSGKGSPSKKAQDCLFYVRMLYWPSPKVRSKP